MVSLLRETFEWRRLSKLLRNHSRLVFFAEQASYFSYLEGLVANLSGQRNQKLIYITMDKNDPLLKQQSEGVKVVFLRKLIPYVFAFIDCDVMVLTMTDLNRYHIKRSTKPVHYVYVFHSLISTHMGYLEGAFDHYDSVLCAGPHHVEEIRAREKTADINKKHLVSAGYYRLERIYEAYNAQSDDSLSERKTILIAPSWGDDNILATCGEQLVDILLAKKYKVIVRPHPETKRHHPEQISVLKNKFGRNEDFVLEASVATDNSLLEAAVLISDVSGVALEYAIGTGRQVLFIDVPFRKIRNPNYQTLNLPTIELSYRSEFGEVISPDNLDSVSQIIDEFFINRDEFKARMQKKREEVLFSFGRSNDVGGEYISGLVNGTDTTQDIESKE